jgi:hypothetical protein
MATVILSVLYDAIINEESWALAALAALALLYLIIRSRRKREAIGLDGESVRRRRAALDTSAGPIDVAERIVRHIER